MLTGRFNTPLPTNEPVYGYAPGSAGTGIRSRTESHGKPTWLKYRVLLVVNVFLPDEL